MTQTSGGRGSRPGGGPAGDGLGAVGVSSRRLAEADHRPAADPLGTALRRQQSPRCDACCLQAGWPDARLTVIPNGVERNESDPARARARLLKELGLPSNVHLIGAVGPLQPHKRLKDLIWSVDQLNLVRDDCCLLIIGQGPHDWRLRRFADQVVLRGGVFFLGPEMTCPRSWRGWIACGSPARASRCRTACWRPWRPAYRSSRQTSRPIAS